MYTSSDHGTSYFTHYTLQLKDIKPINNFLSSSYFYLKNLCPDDLTFLALLGITVDFVREDHHIESIKLTLENGVHKLMFCTLQ